ncbi:MAG: zf-TFIIB domain-containing protein [Cyanobacteriota bacterium]
MGLTCPNCKDSLEPKIIGGIEVDFCEKGCKGIWFDEGELKKIREFPDDSETLKTIEGNFTPKLKEEALKEDARMCPRCNIELYKYNWDMRSNIFLDSCEQCNGLWIDAGELIGMNEYLKEMSAKTMPNEEEIKLKLAEIEHRTRAKMKQDQDDNVNKVIDWDLWLFDDMLRFLVRKFVD